MKKGVLRNFKKFIGKHLCWSCFFKESCRPQACNFTKKENLTQVLSSEFCEISKKTFFTEHLCATASINLKEKEEIAKEFSIKKVAWQPYNYSVKKGTPLQLFCRCSKTLNLFLFTICKSQIDIQYV